MENVLIILTPGFPKDIHDPTCLPAVQQFVLSVKKLYPGLRLIVLSFQYPFEKKSYDWHGIEVVALGGKNKPTLRRFLVWMRAYQTLRRIKKKHNVTGLLSLWLTECALVGEFFRKMNSLPHYMWLHGQDAKASNQYMRRIKPDGRHVIAISDFIRDHFFANHGVRPFLVAENGITESAYPPFNLESRPVDILGVGPLIPLKNYALFLQIVAEIKTKIPTLNVVIAGSGIEETRLKNLAIQLHLSDTVRFQGTVAHPTILELMSKSKVFLHTSNYEGNSTVLMESLYSGCFAFSTTPLSDKPTKNLTICNGQTEFANAITTCLSQNAVRERVLFNNMDTTAKKIIDLFI